MTATKYILSDVVGTGGMGIVHRAVAEGSSTPVAIKQLRPELVAEPLMVRRFETELRVGQALVHPNIVRLVDHGDTPLGPPFLVMAWADGESLATLLSHGGAMEEIDAVSIVSRLCEALAFAHEHGVAHGDVKPANVLVAGEGDAAMVTLIDWDSRGSSANTRNARPSSSRAHPATWRPRCCAVNRPGSAPMSTRRA